MGASPPSWGKHGRSAGSLAAGSSQPPGLPRPHGLLGNCRGASRVLSVIVRRLPNDTWGFRSSPPVGS
eukprot:7235250-Heterocapsa_arctica.AAC.1